MIGLVRLALRRPYTMAIAGMLILLMGFLSARRMVVDIFPNIDIPVVYVAWNYPGLSAEDMERRVVLVSERSYSTTVNGIERIESLSIPGLGILKVYFTPGTDIGGAISQINAQNNSILRIAPPGITPPNMIRFNASNVPVVQITLNSKTLPEQQIFDYGLNFLRVSCSPSRACRSLRPTAASSARSSSTSIRRSSVPRASRRWTWSRPCRPPTSSCLRASPASASASSTSS
jgi:multidrug efflux pump subunit AcrB